MQSTSTNISAQYTAPMYESDISGQGWCASTDEVNSSTSNLCPCILLVILYTGLYRFTSFDTQSPSISIVSHVFLFQSTPSHLFIFATLTARPGMCLLLPSSRFPKAKSALVVFLLAFCENTQNHIHSLSVISSTIVRNFSYSIILIFCILLILSPLSSLLILPCILRV